MDVVSEAKRRNMKSHKNKGRTHTTTTKKRWSGGNRDGDIEVILSNGGTFTIAQNDRARVSKTKKLVQMLQKQKIPMVFSSSSCPPCNKLVNDAAANKEHNHSFVILKYHDPNIGRFNPTGINFFKNEIGIKANDGQGIPFLTTDGITRVSWKGDKLTQLNEMANSKTSVDVDKTFIKDYVHEQSSPVRKLVKEFKDQGPSSITGNKLTTSIQGLRANIKGLRDEYNAVLNKSPTTETLKFNALKSGFKAYYDKLTEFCKNNNGANECTELLKRANKFKEDLENPKAIDYEEPQKSTINAQQPTINAQQSTRTVPQPTGNYVTEPTQDELDAYQEYGQSKWDKYVETKPNPSKEERNNELDRIRRDYIIKIKEKRKPTNESNGGSKKKHSRRRHNTTKSSKKSQGSHR